MTKLSGKKIKAKAANKVERKDNKMEETDEDDEDYVSQVKTRNDLTIDYTQIHNVKERLEILT
jgi:hypothetical protein